VKGCETREALKGRANRCAMVGAPFQGSTFGLDALPRALPGAILMRPVEAGIVRRRSGGCAPLGRELCPVGAGSDRGGGS
jgi:hypothetical protein